jgi:hypothetical protein
MAVRMAFEIETRTEGAAGASLTSGAFSMHNLAQFCIGQLARIAKQRYANSV